MKFFGYNAEDTASDKAFELRETTIVTESIEEIDSLIEFLQFVKHSHLKETGKCENMSVHTHYRDWENALDVKSDLIIITDPPKKDEAAYTDILAEFTEKLNSDDYKGMGDSEKLEIMVDYLDRAERDPHIAMQVAQGIFYTLDLPDEKKKPHIMKACGIALRFSGDKELRRRASAMMAVVCGDDELEMLSELCLSEEYNEAVEHPISLS